MNIALGVLAFMCVAEFGVIYVLVNRLMVQAGQRQMKPMDSLDSIGGGIQPQVPIKHERIPTGTVRVTG